MVNILLQSLGAPAGDEPLWMQLVNTVGVRRSATPNEYLATPEDLRVWLVDRKLASKDVTIDAEFRERALRLRDAIYRVLSSVAAAQAPAASDLETLNDELCEAMAKLELGTDLQWDLTEEDERERALMLVALSAAELLTSPLRSRIRECADSECGWLFIDSSKNRTRRWCSMSDCGNLAKARRYAERHRRS